MDVTNVGRKNVVKFHITAKKGSVNRPVLNVSLFASLCYLINAV